MTRRSLLLASALALAIGAGAAAQTPPAEDAPLAPGNVARGRQIAQQRCAACHSIAGTRASPVRAAPRFSRIGRRFPIDSLAEALAEGIGVRPHQTVQMPEFTLEPQEIEDLLSYMRSIQR